MMRRTRYKLWRVAALCLVAVSFFGLILSIFGVGFVGLNKDSDRMTGELRCLICFGSIQIPNPYWKYSNNFESFVITVHERFAHLVETEHLIIQFPQAEPYKWNPNMASVTAFFGVVSTYEDYWSERWYLIQEAFLLRVITDQPGWGNRRVIYFEDGDLKMIQIPAGIPFILSVVVVLIVFRRTRPFPRGHCTECNYNLTNDTTGTCPECGTTCDSNPVKSTAAVQNP